MLLLDLGWSVVSRVWLMRKGRLHKGLLRGLRERERRPQLLEAASRRPDAEANMYAAADADAGTNPYDSVANRERRAELRVRMEEFYVAFDGRRRSC